MGSANLEVEGEEDFGCSQIGSGSPDLSVLEEMAVSINYQELNEATEYILNKQMDGWMDGLPLNGTSELQQFYLICD